MESRPTLAALGSPAGVAIDSRGDIYIADGAAHRIRKIDIERRHNLHHCRYRQSGPLRRRRPRIERRPQLALRTRRRRR